jgi:hypothetical protein
VLACRYHDRYRKEVGRWRFEERLLRFWYLMNLSDLPHRMAERDRKYIGGRWFPADLPESIPSYRRFYEMPD